VGFHLLLSIAVGIAISTLDQDKETLLAAYLGSVLPAGGLLGAWSVFGRGDSLRRVLLVVMLLVAILVLQFCASPRIMALMSVPMICVQWFGVQIPYLLIRLLGHWRLAGPSSADYLLPHEHARFRSVAGITGLVVLVGTGCWLTVRAVNASGTEQLQMPEAYVVACGANVVVGCLAIRAALVQRDTAAWVAIALIGTAIATMIESHLFAHFRVGLGRHDQHLPWCANGIHLGLTLISLWVARICGFRFQRIRSATV